MTKARDLSESVNPNSIPSTRLSDSVTIGASKLSDGAITSSKILDGAVTNSKIDNQSLTLRKLTQSPSSDESWKRLVESPFMAFSDVFLASSLTVGRKQAFESPVAISNVTYDSSTQLVTITTAQPHNLSPGKNVVIRSTTTGYQTAFNCGTPTSGSTITLSAPSNPIPNGMSGTLYAVAYAVLDPNGAVIVGQTKNQFDTNNSRWGFRFYVGNEPEFPTPGDPKAVPPTEMFNICVNKPRSATILRSTRDLNAAGLSGVPQRVALAINGPDGQYPGDPTKWDGSGGFYAVLTGTGLKVAGYDTDQNAQGPVHVRADNSGSVTGLVLQNRNASGTPEIGLRFTTGATDISDQRYAEISSYGGSTSNLLFKTANGVNTSTKMMLSAAGQLLIGTTNNTGGALLQVDGNRIRVSTQKTPASASDSGATGEICWDSNYVYVCVASNTWKRSQLLSW